MLNKKERGERELERKKERRESQRGRKKGKEKKKKRREEACETLTVTHFGWWGFLYNVRSKDSTVGIYQLQNQKIFVFFFKSQFKCDFSVKLPQILFRLLKSFHHLALNVYNKLNGWYFLSVASTLVTDVTNFVNFPHFSSFYFQE